MSQERFKVNLTRWSPVYGPVMVMSWRNAAVWFATVSEEEYRRIGQLVGKVDLRHDPAFKDMDCVKHFLAHVRSLKQVERPGG